MVPHLTLCALCIHVVLKVPLFPYHKCRQSLTYFSAPAGKNFGLKDSKSAYFLYTKIRDISRIFRDIKKNFGTFRHFLQNFRKDALAILRDICAKAYFWHSFRLSLIQPTVKSITQFSGKLSRSLSQQLHISEFELPFWFINVLK